MSRRRSWLGYGDTTVHRSSTDYSWGAHTQPATQTNVTHGHGQNARLAIRTALTLTVPVTTIDALRHFETG